MERLTSEINGRAVPIKFDLDFAFDMPQHDWSGLQEMFDRLSAYEETGLEPEEIMETVKLFSGTNVDVPKEIIGWVKRATWHCKRLAELTRLVSFDRLRELAQAEKEGRLVEGLSDV